MRPPPQTQQELQSIKMLLNIIICLKVHLKGRIPGIDFPCGSSIPNRSSSLILNYFPNQNIRQKDLRPSEIESVFCLALIHKFALKDRDKCATNVANIKHELNGVTRLLLLLRGGCSS